MKDYKVNSDTEAKTLYRYTKYEYDSLNRLKSVAEFNTSTEPTAEELNANKITYSYDIRDNLIEIRYPDKQMGVLGMTFSYDNITNLVTKAEAVTESDEGRVLFHSPRLMYLTYQKVLSTISVIQSVLTITWSFLNLSKM